MSSAIVVLFSAVWGLTAALLVTLVVCVLLYLDNSSGWRCTLIHIFLGLEDFLEITILRYTWMETQLMSYVLVEMIGEWNPVWLHLLSLLLWLCWWVVSGEMSTPTTVEIRPLVEETLVALQTQKIKQENHQTLLNLKIMNIKYHQISVKGRLIHINIIAQRCRPQNALWGGCSFSYAVKAPITSVFLRCFVLAANVSFFFSIWTKFSSLLYFFTQLIEVCLQTTWFS